MIEDSKYKPDSLIENAAKHGELVVFVGAGVSMLCGSPDWRGFANKVVDELEKDDVLSFLEAEQLREFGDSRRTLSIAISLAKTKRLKIDFDSILHPSDPHPDGRELYRLLRKWKPVFVTTNYDKWLDDPGPEDLSSEIRVESESEPAKLAGRIPKYYSPGHLSPALLAERGSVIHLHGTYMEPESMVVSLKDYIEHYADPRVKAFLSEMFRHYTVLFVGYGLAELEILEHVIRSNDSLETGTARHVLLYPYRSTESVQKGFIEDYFREQCGVHISPYCIDNKGYREVVDVFRIWVSELDIREPTILNLQVRLDGYINSPNLINRKAALEMVQKNPNLYPYFMNSLRDPVWFGELDDKGFFNVKHSPWGKIVENEWNANCQDEEWPALHYLERIAGQTQGNEASRIADIVRTTSTDAQTRGLDNLRTWWSLATILSQLPLDVISDQDIEMIRFWLTDCLGPNLVGQELGEKLLPRLLDSLNSADWQKALLLVDDLVMKRDTEESSLRGEYAVLDSHQLGEVLKTSAGKLGERCGAEAVGILARRLTEHTGSVEIDRRYSLKRSAIEKHEQDAYKEGTREVLIDAVRDSALGATRNSADEGKAATKLLLESPYPTVIRVGIYVCSEHYGTVGEVFWDCVKEDWFINPSYWHELYWLIRKTFPRFSATERSRFLDFVNRVRGDWSDESRQQELDERCRRDLLHPAFGLGDEEVDEKYRSLVQCWGPIRDHPDFVIYMSDWTRDSSSVASDKLIGMSDEELMDFLTDFVPDSQSLDGLTYQEVASSISKAVRRSEDGFARRIKLFSGLARPYQHGLIRGLKERWSDNKQNIDWSATLSLLQTVVSSPAFESDMEADKVEQREFSVHRIVCEIADLLKEAFGVERHLPTELYISCLELLRLFLEALPPRMAGQSDNAVLNARNSSRGRVLEAFIFLALAMRREAGEVNPAACEIWVDIGPVFDAELETSESGRNADFATLAGMYCPNLHYINPQWTEDNFERLFSSSNEAAWRSTAQGFAYQRYLYDWLFDKLVAGDHLRKMVYSKGLPDQVAEKALQFLGLAYLEGMECLDDDGLLSELVTDLRVKELSQLCWFFWTFRGENEPSRHASGILAFWMKVANQVQASKEVDPELQSALNLLVVFVQELSPSIVDALVQAAPHAQIRHHGYILIKNLARLVSEYPEEVAIIFRAAMSGFLPNYQKEDVIGCVTGLWEAGEIDEAEWICNEYAEGGSTLLKETYNKLRAQQRLQDSI